MLITYFDEVKYQNGKQPYYWLGGLVVSAEHIWLIENRVADLAQQVFGAQVLARSSEFHAADIFHRKSNFKPWNNIDKRIDVIKRLIDIVNQCDDIGKIYVKIDPSKMIANDYEQKAFMFFVEKAESYLKSKNSPGILIGDRENDKVSGDFAEILSQYRLFGTPYHFGTKLEYLIDTVHFTDSHHSRMLQLADLYVWVMQLISTGDANKYPASLIFDYVRVNNGICTPSRYKEWPTEQSWIRV
jgi:hypothetical protein